MGRPGRDALRAEHQLAGVLFCHRARQLRPERDRLRRLRHPVQLRPGELHSDHPYQYMPDVAGALAFMYNLTGKQRASRSQTWCSTLTSSTRSSAGGSPLGTTRQIAQLNPQLAGDLPGTTILPVYRVDASGENYLLSDYLLHMDGSASSRLTRQAMQARHICRPTVCDLADPVAGETRISRTTRGGRRRPDRPERFGQRGGLRFRGARATGRSPTSRPPTRSSTTNPSPPSSTRPETPCSRRR